MSYARCPGCGATTGQMHAPECTYRAGGVEGKRCSKCGADHTGWLRCDQSVCRGEFGGYYAPKPTEGRKDDSGKVRYELLPPELLEATAQVLTFGAKKYGDRNWEKGMNWSRPFAALMRHIWAWWRGEAQDAETGYSHLWHAACCLAFLIAYEQRKIGADDRPQK